MPACRRQGGDVKLAVCIYVAGWIADRTDFDTTWAGCVPESSDAGGCRATARVWAAGAGQIRRLGGRLPGRIRLPSCLVWPDGIPGNAPHTHCTCQPSQDPSAFPARRQLHAGVGDKGAPAPQLRPRQAADDAGRGAVAAAGHPQLLLRRGRWARELASGLGGCKCDGSSGLATVAQPSRMGCEARRIAACAHQVPCSCRLPSHRPDPAAAGLVAALGPTVLLGTASGLLISNAWAVASDRAVKAGKQEGAQVSGWGGEPCGHRLRPRWTARTVIAACGILVPKMCATSSCRRGAAVHLATGPSSALCLRRQAAGAPAAERRAWRPPGAYCFVSCSTNTAL